MNTRNSIFATVQPVITATIDKKRDLMAKFAHDEPPYLKKHQDTRVRLPNPVLVQDALEGARKRFEEQLLKERQREERIELEGQRFEEDHKTYYEEVEMHKLKPKRYLKS